MSNHTSQPISNTKGIIWALVGVGLFAMIYVSGKLSGTPASALQIMWLRYIGGLLTITAFVLWPRKEKVSLATTQPLIHACRAAAGGFGGVAAVYAASNMPVASASSIGLLDGLITVFFGLIFLREFVSLRQWTATLVCLVGAYIVVGSQGAFSDWQMVFLLPALIALLGAVLVATESILIKTLVYKESAVSVLFYVNLFGCSLLTIPGLMNWVSVDPIWVLFFLMLGPIAIVAQYCNIQAFRRAPASVIGPVRYAWIIYGSLFGLFFFQESVTVMMTIGMVLILLGGGWLAQLRNHR